jgi:glycosyltransferase involved in cell wall biosynthesis
MILRQVTLAIQLVRLSKTADVIYAQGPIVVGLTSVIIGKILKKSVVIKFVGDIAWEEAERRGVTDQDLQGFLENKHHPFAIRLLQWLQTQSLNRSKNIIVPSQFLKHILIQSYAIDAQKVSVIHNAVALPKNIPRRLTKELTIVSSGRLVAHKRFERVVDAFAKLKKLELVKERLRLIIIGDGLQKQILERQIKRLKLENTVQITGALNRASYLRALSSACLFVLASSYEGLPHAIIEAMLLGIPVVATDIPGNREVITDRRTGLLAQADTASLARAMHEALTDRTLAGNLTRYAKKQARGRYNWKTHSERLIHLLRQELTAA